MLKLCSLLAAPLLFVTQPSSAFTLPESGSMNQIIRTPGYVGGGAQKLIFMGSQTQNAAHDSIALPNGATAITSVGVDEVHGQLHTFVDYSQPNPSSTSATYQAFGILGAYSVFHAQSAANTNPVAVTFEMTFHAKFSNRLSGLSSLNLAGGVDLGISASRDGPTLESDTAFLSFADLGGRVQTRQITEQQFGNDPANPNFSGAHITVNSMALDNIVGTVSVTDLPPPAVPAMRKSGLKVT